MFNEIIKKREEILTNWVKMVDFDIDEVEIKYQFSKLFDAIVNMLEGEAVENIEDFVEDMSKYEIPPKDITEALISLLDLLEKENLNEAEILKLNKIVYSLAIKVYEEFEKNKLKIMATQLETIKKMEIPILQLDSNTILVPLIGFIDSQKALNLMRKVLEKIRKDKTLKVIVDIEGIPVIDTEVAHQFLRLYRGIKAIGAKLVMSGITPAVAETMVHLEIDLPIPTRATLELAIEAFKDEEI
jgi:rsbT co-antagonist protein RsbR